MKRREFLAGSLAAGGGLLAAGRLPAAPPIAAFQQGGEKPFQQPPLPFAIDGLKPFLSEEQMTYHYRKHHAGYFKKLNALVEGRPEAAMPLREVVVRSTGPIFNNAAQAWNHGFFWECLSPDGGGRPEGKLAEAVERDFGGWRQFTDAFSRAAAGLFGSGWAWLAADGAGKLDIMPLGNADTPLKYDKEPVLTIDVWEHAYYLDYRNRRAKYVEGFWNVADWEFVQQRYAATLDETT